MYTHGDKSGQNGEELQCITGSMTNLVDSPKSSMLNYVASPRHLDSAMALTDANRWHSLCWDRFSLRISRRPIGWREVSKDGTLSHEQLIDLFEHHLFHYPTLDVLTMAAMETTNIHEPLYTGVSFYSRFLTFAHKWHVSSGASEWLCKRARLFKQL